VSANDDYAQIKALGSEMSEAFERKRASDDIAAMNQVLPEADQVENPYVMKMRFNWMTPLFSPPGPIVNVVEIEDEDLFPATAWRVTDEDGNVVASSDGTGE
jgi:hypothetical protein